jgi:hypothetical protein
MATANRATLINMQGKLQAMGGVAKAVIGEPKSAVQDGLVSIIPLSGSIDETTLTAPREVHLVMLRRYVNAMREPTEETEFEMDAWRADVMEDIFGDFDLGGNVAYALPTQFLWNYGYQTIENTIYRLLDLTVAYRIDDNASFAA